MKDFDILLLYKEKRTPTREYLKDKNLKEVIEDIKKESLDDYEYRTGLGYIKKRSSKDSIINRKFIDRIGLEHAQKFYLYEYGTFHKKKIKNLGYIFAYELPFFKSRTGGAIDLVAYDEKSNTINLIEMKNCDMEKKKDSNHSLINTILEIETYTKLFIDIINHEENNELLKEIANELKKLYNLKNSDKKDISVEELKTAKIQKTLLIPKTLYDKSFKNKKEKEILKNMPKDIKIHFISLKDKNFNANQRIVDVAKEDNLIFNIE